MIERTKSFDYMHAVGRGFRIRVCVMRDVDNRCFATAQLGNRAFRYGGGYSPSGAFVMLISTLKRALASMPSTKRLEIELWQKEAAS